MTFRTNEAQRWGGDIEVLLDLLDRWTEEVFPASSRSTNDSLILVALWRELADVLYQYHSDLWDILVDEIEQGLLTPDKANPPTRALAQSLSQLMRVGLREAFLVGAIRQAMDQLVSIAGAEPANAWHRLADAM